MANKPYYGVNPAYSPQQANSMLSELYPAMAQATKTGLGNVRTGLGNVWNSMDNTSKAATVVGLVPGIGQVGDIAGLADDARLFYQNPEMRTPANFGLSALGLLPLMPSMGMVKGVGKGIAGSIVPPIDVVKNIKPKPIKAPASDVGFYSPVEKAALNLNRNQGSGQSFLNDLKKGENVKGDELTYTELEDWLKTKPNLTRQEVQDYIINNKLDVEEVVLGGKKNRQNMQYTKHAKYQLPNGDNYKEILLKLPEKTRPATLAEVNAAKAKISDRLELMTQKEYDDLVRSGEVPKINSGEGERQYQSSHWDEPNVLAHIRTNQRLDANGRKTTLIEEIQSDWHQAGRKKGYGPQIEKSVEGYYETKDGQRISLGFGKNKEEAEASIDVGWKNIVDIKYEALERKVGDGVPDAPFKDDWYKLALKRAIKEAVENGSDSISLTTGKRQIERYSEELRQNVDMIEFMKGYPSQGTTTITASKNGQPMFQGNVVDGKFIDGAAEGKTIDKVLGKSITQKIQNYEPSQKFGTIAGDDLSIGGEGMKKYYDEIYPAFLNSFGKKYGVKVEDNIIDIGTPEKVYTLPITPQMREDVLKGQPLTDKNEQDKNQYYA